MKPKLHWVGVWDKLLTYVRKVQFGLGLKFKTGLRKLWLSVLVGSGN